MAKAWPIVGVGAVIWRGPEALLLVRRGQAPRLGEWSLPGGRVEPGEQLREALTREIAEETGVTVTIGGLIDAVDLVTRNAGGEIEAHFVLLDFNAHWLSGEPCPASDVTDCRWFAPADALEAVSWGETRRIISLSANQLWQMPLSS